jgi:hypothetical protein
MPTTKRTLSLKREKKANPARTKPNSNLTQVRNTLAAVGGEFVDAAAVSITSLSAGSVLVATRTVCATQALAEQYMLRLRDTGELAFQSNPKLLPLLPVTFSNLQVRICVRVRAD